MRVVAVSQRVDIFPDRNEVRDALDQRLITFLLMAGYIPFPVPNGLYRVLPDGQFDSKLLEEWLTRLKPHAYVLSGGNDIGQCISRDLVEVWLLDHARLHKAPVLGICRGMQVMANFAGTELLPIQGHLRTRHHLFGEITGEVNSFHAFALAACPAGFEVLAKSENGEIEAIRHRSLFWEGWMWHPEREEQFSTIDLDRIKMLFGG
jgi:putative glutamine amidotransferase